MSNTQHRVTGPAQITGVSTGVGQHRLTSPAQITVGASSGTAPRRSLSAALVVPAAATHPAGADQRERTARERTSEPEPRERAGRSGSVGELCPAPRQYAAAASCHSVLRRSSSGSGGHRPQPVQTAVTGTRRKAHTGRAAEHTAVVVRCRRRSYRVRTVEVSMAVSARGVLLDAQARDETLDQALERIAELSRRLWAAQAAHHPQPVRLGGRGPGRPSGTCAASAAGRATRADRAGAGPTAALRRVSSADAVVAERRRASPSKIVGRAVPG